MRLVSYAKEKGGGGGWPWVIQRLTAAIIFLFLGTHIWVLHFSEPSEMITLEGVAQRLGSPLFMTIDILLLATAIYHSLNGVRSIVIDFGISPGARRALSWSLVVIGIIAFIFAVNTLATIRGTPLF